MLSESIQPSKLTFRAARTNLNLSLEYAAECAKITSEELSVYEDDSGETPFKVAVVLCRMYRISLSHIHIGETID